MGQNETRPDPSVVLDLLEAFRQSKTMFAAVELGVFDALELGPLSLATLANRLNVNRDALPRLLDACVGLQLLRRERDNYSNTPSAAAYLCSKSADRLSDYIRYSNEYLWKLWGNLEDAVRKGTHRWKQTFGWDDDEIFAHFFRTEKSTREFVLSLHGYGLVSSPAVRAAFDLSGFQQLVDLGGGTGHLAIEICENYPTMQAKVFDLPVARKFALEKIAGSSAANRISFVDGDFFDDDHPLPEGDLFTLMRVIHDWSEARVSKLLTRIFDRLPSGGALLIAEKLIDEDRAGPKWAQMQNLAMLLYCEGKERTLTEYESFLRSIGFSEVRAAITDTPLDAVLAVKG
jgi:acetylserotonin N-methyltransferase